MNIILDPVYLGVVLIGSGLNYLTCIEHKSYAIMVNSACYLLLHVQ